MCSRLAYLNIKYAYVESGFLFGAGEELWGESGTSFVRQH